MARDTYEKIKDLSQTSPELLPLAPADLQVNTAILGAAQKGQQNKQLSWIWSFGISGKKNGTWMDEFNRVHWLRVKAQFEQWKEEEDSVHNEADWIPTYFHAKAERWKRWMKNAAQGQLAGHEAYASRQIHIWEEMSLSSRNALTPITSPSHKA
ncbi:hypothetical protein EI94DRAFT_1707314 [Lactarius quietus]|nr:hypothetical protein EI94DRAFT_1707314 [Lactarius quietus]